MGRDCWSRPKEEARASRPSGGVAAALWQGQPTALGLGQRRSKVRARGAALSGLMGCSHRPHRDEAVRCGCHSSVTPSPGTVSSLGTEACECGHGAFSTPQTLTGQGLALLSLRTAQCPLLDTRGSMRDSHPPPTEPEGSTQPGVRDLLCLVWAGRCVSGWPRDGVKARPPLTAPEAPPFPSQYPPLPPSLPCLLSPPTSTVYCPPSAPGLVIA